ncbi:MAG: tRNA lysidine(34) synthetase TilS, partial [Bryobacterales bacterium]|nr:tRNA lysidine(34) synthetase TilS [Bryobacterales bacterium]
MSVAVIDTVAATISRHRMLSPADRVIVAVSGGPDSVCLLDVLTELAPRLNVTISGVGHLNHKLRGDESDQDEEFVRAVAQRCGIEFHREEVDLRGAGNLEQAARQARRAFFNRLTQAGVANRIATGHTRDDQAETVLFRLIRGSGPNGIAGILPVTAEGLIRPLLDIARSDIREYLMSRGLAWREDSTNRDIRFSRNRIRHELLPQLAREWNPRIAEALARFADITQEEERWWAAEIGRVAAIEFTETDDGLEISAKQLAEMPKTVSRRLIRYAIAKIRDDDLPLAFEHIDAVLHLAAKREGEGTAKLPGLEAIRSFGQIRLQRESEHAPARTRVTVPGRYPWGATAVCFDHSGPSCEPGICARLKL